MVLTGPVEVTRGVKYSLTVLRTWMCSVASFDYVRRNFGNRHWTPSSISLHSMHRRHMATKLFTSFYLQLRQGRCAVIKCTQSTATDTILYTPTQKILFCPIQPSRPSRRGKGGQICTGRSSCTGLFLWRTLILCLENGLSRRSKSSTKEDNKRRQHWDPRDSRLS